MKLEPVIQLPTAWSGFWRGLGVHLFHGRLTLGTPAMLAGSQLARTIAPLRNRLVSPRAPSSS